jgi:hypothetical protein
VGGFFMTGSEISETPHELLQKKKWIPINNGPLSANRRGEKKHLNKVLGRYHLPSPHQGEKLGCEKEYFLEIQL